MRFARWPPFYFGHIELTRGGTLQGGLHPIYMFRLLDVSQRNRNAGFYFSFPSSRTVVGEMKWRWGSGLIVDGYFGFWIAHFGLKTIRKSQSAGGLGHRRFSAARIARRLCSKRTGTCIAR